MEIYQNLPSLFILYLVLSSNFLLPLFSCQVQRFISQSMISRHLLGYLTMTFFVILANSQDPLPLDKMFGLSAIFYIWFLFTTRLSLPFWILIIFILAGAYILNIFEKEEKEEENKEKYKSVKYILTITTAILTFVGVLLYYGEKKIEYGKNFDIYQFILGKSECQGKSPKISLKKSLLSALNLNK